MYTSLLTSIIKDKERNREIWVSRFPGWLPTCTGDVLRIYHFLSFKEAIEFVNEIGLVAQTAQHFPEISIHGPTVNVKLKAHPERGLSDKDMELIERLEELPYTEIEVPIIQ